MLQEESGGSGCLTGSLLFCNCNVLRVQHQTYIALFTYPFCIISLMAFQIDDSPWLHHNQPTRPKLRTLWPCNPRPGPPFFLFNANTHIPDLKKGVQKAPLNYSTLDLHVFFCLYSFQDRMKRKEFLFLIRLYKDP